MNAPINIVFLFVAVFFSSILNLNAQKQDVEFTPVSTRETCIDKANKIEEFIEQKLQERELHTPIMTFTTLSKEESLTGRFMDPQETYVDGLTRKYEYSNIHDENEELALMFVFEMFVDFNKTRYGDVCFIFVNTTSPSDEPMPWSPKDVQSLEVQSVIEHPDTQWAMVVEKNGVWIELPDAPMLLDGPTEAQQVWAFFSNTDFLTHIANMDDEELATYFRTE